MRKQLEVKRATIITMKKNTTAILTLSIGSLITALFISLYLISLTPMFVFPKGTGIITLFCSIFTTLTNSLLFGLTFGTFLFLY
jgi:hypothetical protein